MTKSYYSLIATDEYQTFCKAVKDKLATAPKAAAVMPITLANDLIEICADLSYQVSYYASDPTRCDWCGDILSYEENIDRICVTYLETYNYLHPYCSENYLECYPNWIVYEDHAE